MDTNAIKSKLNLLLQFIDLDMEACKTTGIKLRNRTWQFRLASILISLLITITLGLTLNTDEIFLGINIGIAVKNIAVILSAVLTAINTWEAFRNYQTRYSQESSMINKLNILSRDIMLYLDSNNNCMYEEYTEFKRRYDAIQEEYIQERTSSSKDEGESEGESEDSN
ncbi:hypothetical protein BK125_30650 [Paenibacillus odorifer]|uniref:DUF4231 domain-containing protein n=1 Tax=Paenibacillus odorifer TaxID=189426 RepID=A0ABX3GCB5_9BACL|nr:SLATT domain-containing protein [Paenibacillus odorifer]OMC63970.1 hypothetical protein BK125_30650 [Paenibacillus odorifer]OMC96921.1 hypothetical protein BSO21_33495 [Paenibacillus odorifer]